MVDAPLPTRRSDLLARLAASQAEGRVWDVAIVGGGATGLGTALAAVARGYSVLLLESHDFASGTSSRSTKLLHGGVRYLAQGNVHLVREALHERGAALAAAPHLSAPLPFIVPSYAWWQAPFYGLGLFAYDLLAGRSVLGLTKWLTRAQTLKALPQAQPQGLRGGVQYWDGQFDDARLAMALARTAAREGALLLNYCEVKALTHEGGQVAGLRCRDTLNEQGLEYEIKARCVINATGVWVDGLRAMEDENTEPLVSPSQGVHLVVDQSFLPADKNGQHHALLVPHTADGRVLFAVPWLGKLVLGTTDTPRSDHPREPMALKAEVDFILREAGRYLARAPRPSDVLSVWAGLRPLVKDVHAGRSTKALSREHTILQAASGLITVTGGKWTTYRAMAEDVLAHAVQGGLLPKKETPAHLPRLVGAPASRLAESHIATTPGAHLYGSEAALLAELPGAGVEIAPGLTEAMIRFAVRHEYAQTVEDVLARRSRLLFLDAAKALEAAPAVASLLERETGQNPGLDEFLTLARQYSTLP